MLSRLQELKKEEETLLKIKAALHDQLNRLKVEELALQSMISAGEEEDQQSQVVQPEADSMSVDDEVAINQTELQLSTVAYNQEEEDEEEEEEDSDT
ncbi:snRNA-activating protein complex subunit 5 [Anomaloglossus baeobatrachus]|uniref:snRNA-activating protein complex subunit 5 n=1 Tax=Anomaloglossus baeobatrachus TaxID=238106 RepID=UPI003F4F613E